MFSLLPRCQGEWESQKYTGTPRDWVIARCLAISVPWSHVMERSRSGGRSATRAFITSCRVSPSRVGEVEQPNQSGLPFDQGVDRGSLLFADDQVAFPVAGLGPVGGWERTLVNGEHGLLEPGAAAVLPLLGTAVVTTGAQRRGMLRREP